MDIWDQVYLYIYWNKQINRSIIAKTAACPRRQAVFFLEKTEALRMKRYLRDYSNTNLLPSGEIKKTKSVSEDKIPKIDYYRAV